MHLWAPPTHRACSHSPGAPNPAQPLIFAGFYDLFWDLTNKRSLLAALQPDWIAKTSCTWCSYWTSRRGRRACLHSMSDGCNLIENLIMIFAELNGCPLQATISLTLSGFPSRGPHIPPPSPFYPLLHFHSMPLTNHGRDVRPHRSDSGAARRRLVSPSSFCVEAESVCALLNNQWAALQVAVGLLSLVYGSITVQPDAVRDSASQSRILEHRVSRCDTQLITEGIPLFSHYTSAPFQQMQDVNTCYMFLASAPPPPNPTWRCNDPICPERTLKFHLMCSNGVVQTLQEDSPQHPKPYYLQHLLLWPETFYWDLS